ncbi:hypothetical protein ABZ901_26895 [Actinacidiphila alni]|uniref:hypothetical protein n=1 Tax=Actinacidiphila alni TaxID=380248 RepID=UPI0033D3A052
MTVTIGFHAAADTRVDLFTYGTEGTPILDLSGSEHSLTISAFSRVSNADHLAFAKALATAAAEYVTALETYAAAHPDGS